ncbi:MAG: PH domain-containing protein [Candidatus Izemoplasmatales bacterium]|nr:PH domain-containing protein [bacterium]MDZ4196826.1 PH domain-containing protein [Candidatus Izemoplasmatales bacterium]
MKKLDKRINLYYYFARTIASLLFYISFIVVLIIPQDFFDHPIIKMGLLLSLGFLVIILILFNFILPRYIYLLHGYELQEEYLMIKKGVLFRREDYIPIKRIQHIEGFQGPIQMLFKIKSLIIYTAGSTDMIIGIPSDDIEPLIHEIRSKLQVYLDSEEAKKDEF